jgi:hypothetical protein
VLISVYCLLNGAQTGTITLANGHPSIGKDVSCLLIPPQETHQHTPPKTKTKTSRKFLLVPIITVRSRVSLSDPTHISSLLNWKFHILNAIFHVIKRLNRTKSVTYASLIPIGHGKSARTQRISTSISLGGALMNSSRNDFL